MIRIALRHAVGGLEHSVFRMHPPPVLYHSTLLLNWWIDWGELSCSTLICIDPVKMNYMNPLIYDYTSLNGLITIWQSAAASRTTNIVASSVQMSYNLLFYLLDPHIEKCLLQKTLIKVSVCGILLDNCNTKFQLTLHRWRNKLLVQVHTHTQPFFLFVSLSDTHIAYLWPF